MPGDSQQERLKSNPDSKADRYSKRGDVARSGAATGGVIPAALRTPPRIRKRRWEWRQHRTHTEQTANAALSGRGATTFQET